MRAAEHIVDFEKRLEQQREGDGDNRRIMPTRAQHWQHQEQADQRRRNTARGEHDEMRHRSIGAKDRRRISANAEKGCAGEVQHPGIAELNVQAERRDAVEQNRDDQEHREMIVMEVGGDCDDCEDGAGA